MNSAPSERASTGQCRGERGSQPRERSAVIIRPQLGGDHVEVADHEAHDLHEQVGHPQPLAGRASRSCGSVVAARVSEARTPSVPLTSSATPATQAGLGDASRRAPRSAVRGRRTASAPRRPRTAPRRPSAAAGSAAAPGRARRRRAGRRPRAAKTAYHCRGVATTTSMNPSRARTLRCAGARCTGLWPWKWSRCPCPAPIRPPTGGRASTGVVGVGVAGPRRRTQPERARC